MRMTSTITYDRRGPHLAGGRTSGFLMPQLITVYNSVGVAFQVGNTMLLSSGNPTKVNIRFVVNSAGVPISV